MTEIFPREAAALPEPFTGERLTSALGGQTQIEHYHRYLFARDGCRGLDVLDVASGEGYGSALLAQVAHSVIGLDYSAATVHSAMANFPRVNLVFAQGDARMLPLPDACVDVVISFETIEHFDRQDAFVAEVHRVLRFGGRFIVSTPDREIYSAPGMQPNEFHVREMSRQEFVAILACKFRHVAVMSQRPVIGSALLPDAAGALPPLIFDRRSKTEFEAGNMLPRAPYLVAAASDVALPAFPASLFVERSDLDTDALALAARTMELETVRAALAVRATELETLRATLAAQTQTAAEKFVASDARITLLTDELTEVHGSLRKFLRGYMPRLRDRLFGAPRR